MNSLYHYGIDHSNRQQLSDNDLIRNPSSSSHPMFDYYQQDSRTIPSYNHQFYPDNANQFYRYDLFPTSSTTTVSNPSR